MATENKKIVSRISAYDYGRLDSIAKEYGFKSIYEIMQGLVYCFLRSMEKNDVRQPPSIDEEVDDMFRSLSEYEEHPYVKPKRPYTTKDETKLKE
jgi:hypothetical protein